MTIKEGIRSLLNHLAPAGTFRRNVLQSFWRIILFVRREGLRGLVGKIPSSVRKLKNELKKPQGIFRSAYDLEDNSTVILYTDNPALFPQYQPRRSLSGCQKRWLGVSLISTTYNEKESVVPWLEGIHQQTRLPEEMVIVDGGSQDGTLELLQEYAQKSGLNMRVISRPGANIAAGRNVAITEAHNPIIACSDFGCRPRPDWLEKIVAPIEDRGGNLASDGTSAVQVSAGWFDAIHAGRTTRRLGWASLSDLDPQAFLPSSRSIAFLKDAWQTVGGYPEWLTLTGEDTCFDFALKQACPRWAFVPEAVVEWQAPATPFDYWRKIDLWSVGDGEAGILTGYYWWSLVRILSAPLITLASTAIISLACAAGLVSWFVTLVMILAVWIAALAFPYKGVYRAVGSIPALVWEMGADYARLSGFFRGLQRRRQVTERRFTSTRGLVMILAVVPLEDTGGGSRSAQIAHELLRQNYVVVYLHKFPRHEAVDLEITQNHPNLISMPFSHFRWGSFKCQYLPYFHDKTFACLVELPAPEFIPLVNQIRKAGGVVVYDLLDDWQTSLGSGWYVPSIEEELISISDRLVATAPSLVSRLEVLTQRKVAYLPNAVNSHLFSPNRYYTKPHDLPPAEWYAIYVGALWGEWFDWELLLQIARAYPAAGVVVIGDYQHQFPDHPQNLHFLGLKPQKALPAYLHYANVALIPWKVNEVTQATSPLKVYEYIAMQKPIVAPSLQTLQDLPGVYLARDTADFVAKVGLLRSEITAKQDNRHFISANDWGARVREFLALITLPSFDIIPPEK